MNKEICKCISCVYDNSYSSLAPRIILKDFLVKIFMLPNLRIKLERCVFLIFHINIYPKLPLYVCIFPFLFRIAPPLPDARSVGNLYICPVKNKMHIETRMQDEAVELESSSATPPY